MKVYLFDEIKGKRLKNSEMIVYSYLYSLALKYDEVIITYKTLSERLHLTEVTISNCINKLNQIGLIAYKKDKSKPNRYIIYDNIGNVVNRKSISLMEMKNNEDTIIH